MSDASHTVALAIVRALDSYPAPVRARPAVGQPTVSYNPIAFALAGYAAVLQKHDDTEVVAAFGRAGSALADRAALLETRLIHAAAGSPDHGAFGEATTLLTELGALAAFEAGSRGAAYHVVCGAARQLSGLLPPPPLNWVQQALASAVLEPDG